uniref:Uncharacterized protein n=1 Tax=Siphoviridae sp. ct5FX1 TaxID=2825335 RepID=A0A8S5UPX0_9CAUD|nr:MAG TPA: hypothetical protein [Siphoviridae sp. ct5FX1]
MSDMQHRKCYKNRTNVRKKTLKIILKVLS